MNLAIEVTPKELEDLIPMYLETTFKDYAALKAGYESRNANAVKKVCHRILGTASAYGFIQLDTLCSELIQTIDARDFEASTKVIKHMDRYFYYLENTYQS